MKGFINLSVLIVINLQLFVYAEGKVCELTPRVIEGQNVTNGSQASYQASVKWVCPLEGDRADHLECCGHGYYTPKCCPTVRQFYEIENSLAVIISSTVVSGCVVIALLVIVCCFWSKCPLYNACRARYTDFEIVAYDKTADSSATMPEEPKNKQNNHFFVQCKKLDEENMV